MMNSKMKKFLALYLIPTSVMAEWSKTDANSSGRGENEGRVG
jgi:hypothetical protein